MNRAFASTRIRERPDQLSGRLAPAERDVYSNRANLKTQLLTELGKRCGIVIYKHCIPNGIH
jgi:hypothetical protein